MLPPPLVSPPLLPSTLSQPTIFKGCRYALASCMAARHAFHHILNCTAKCLADRMAAGQACLLSLSAVSVPQLLGWSPVMPYHPHSETPPRLDCSHGHEICWLSSSQSRCYASTVCTVATMPLHCSNVLCCALAARMATGHACLLSLKAAAHALAAHVANGHAFALTQTRCHSHSCWPCLPYPVNRRHTLAACMAICHAYLL